MPALRVFCQNAGMTLAIHSIAPDAGFLPAAAHLILAFARQSAESADLSGVRVLLPNLKLAPALIKALGEAAGGALLLPRMETLSGFAEPWLGLFDALPDARRQLILHALLRRKEWFDEGLLWDVVAELVQLFDALTENAVSLPASETEMLARLEAAFELHDSASLAFEARLVNTLWQAEAQGRPSHAMARLLALHEAISHLDIPLVVIAESVQPGLAQQVAADAAIRAPVLCLQPDRAMARGPLAAGLEAGLPLAPSAHSLPERVVTLPRPVAAAATERLAFMAAESLETLAQTVADQVLEWLHAGKRDIALVAADRLAARRARALLEREGVLVLDETGWKMSTTRVAAVVDAWLEVLSADAYHRALIDLLRAPLLFADLGAMQRSAASLQLERLIRDRNLRSGLDRIHAEAGTEFPAAAELLGRLQEARAAMALQQTASIAEWLRRLEKSLALLGAGDEFAQDVAGIQWLEWLQARSAELAEDEERFSFASWRTWFNRQMDFCLFRDESIDSPVIMTHLAATRLRAFEAAIVIGADSEHLAPPRQPAWLSHAGVRRQLGLPGLELERAMMQEDLAGLVLASGETVIAWQSQRRDEELMPAAEVELLQTALSLALGSPCMRMPTPRHIAASAALQPIPMPAPAVALERVPQKLSASSMQSLVDCPYQYFARHILGLGEIEALQEGLEKREFGEFLHDILKRFHTQFPRLCDEADETLLTALETLTEAAFASPVARNFQDHAWRLRWLARLPAYIAWQREREVEGWLFAAGEESQQRDFELGNGVLLRLNGRIDRHDETAEGNTSLLDYKSRSKTVLKRQALDPDEVQLAFYTLLRGSHVAEAAYVALDDEKIGSIPVSEPELRAELLADCIDHSFVALHQGAGLPAHGSEAACAWCEMRGLCRKEWLDVTGQER